MSDSDFLIIRPVTIDDATLDSSSVPETVAAYSAATVYTLGQQIRDDTSHRIYESASGASLGAATMTVASPCVVTRVAHGLAADAKVCFTTAGALPTGLTAGTIYYVKSPGADTFQLAATPGGAAINTSGTQSGTHSLFSNPNVGKALNDSSFWIDTGPTNRWAMFDNLNSSVTSAADEIVTSISPGQRIDAIGLLNLNATSVRVTATDAIDGIVYDKPFSLVSTSGIVDWYTYFTEPIVLEPDLLVTGLPGLYANLTFEVMLSYLGGTVECGALVAGLAKVAGVSVSGASTGIIDYSKKVTDEFGNTSITRRSYANKGNFRVFCDNANIVALQRLLAQYRAQPALYVGTTVFSNTFIYGFFRDFTLSIEGAEHSYLSIELEGLI